MPDPNGDPTNDDTNVGDANEKNEVNWRDQLGEFASHERVRGFKSLKEMAEAYVSSPTPPQLPESHEGYTLPEKTKIEGLRKMAYSNKLTQEQLNGVLKFNEDITKKAVETINEQRRNAISSLKKDWGDDYEANIKDAQLALKSLDTDGEMTKFLKTSGMSDDPRIAKFLHKIGGTMKEGGYIGSDGNIKKKPKSPASRIFPNHNPKS